MYALYLAFALIIFYLCIKESFNIFPLFVLFVSAFFSSGSQIHTPEQYKPSERQQDDPQEEEQEEENNENDFNNFLFIQP